jgi:hypothetical protein
MKQVVLHFAALPLLGCALTFPVAALAAQGSAPFHNLETFTIDVALDADTLVVNHVDPTQPPTTQFRGDTLVIDGTIYPGGTLPSGIASNSPNTPGGLGKIRCRATVLVPLSDITTPAATFVTEMYSFPDDKQIIIVDGPGANLYATVWRAVTGGTHSFEGVTGVVKEINLGLNASGACNLRITFTLRKPDVEGRDHDR